MSDNMPATAEGNSNACCGTVVGVGFFLFNLTLILLWRGGATSAASMLFLVGVSIFVVFLVVGIIGGRSKDRRYEEMMEGYQEQDWMKDR